METIFLKQLSKNKQTSLFKLILREPVFEKQTNSKGVSPTQGKIKQQTKQED